MTAVEACCMLTVTSYPLPFWGTYGKLATTEPPMYFGRSRIYPRQLCTRLEEVICHQVGNMGIQVTTISNRTKGRYGKDLVETGKATPKSKGLWMILPGCSNGHKNRMIAWQRENETNMFDPWVWIFGGSQNPISRK